jgi:hypothetical protein
MKLFSPLSLITLVSVALAIPQHNHGDSAENFSDSSDVSSTSLEYINSSNEIIGTPADSASSGVNDVSPPDNSASSSEEATRSPVEPTNSFEIEESKSEYKFLGLNIPRGLANANFGVAGVGHVQADVLGSGRIRNSKADVGTNIGGNGYPYPFYYRQYSSPIYSPIYSPYYPSHDPYQSTYNPNNLIKSPNSNPNLPQPDINTLPYIVEYYRPFS